MYESRPLGRKRPPWLVSTQTAIAGARDRGGREASRKLGKRVPEKAVPHKPIRQASAAIPHERLELWAVEPRKRAVAPRLVVGHREGVLFGASLQMYPRLGQSARIRVRVVRFCPGVARAEYVLRRKVHYTTCASGRPAASKLNRKYKQLATAKEQRERRRAIRS